MAETTTGIIASIVVGAPATFDQAGYEALSYTEVDNVTDIGNGGTTQNKVQFTTLKRGEQESEKGSTQFNPRAMQFVYEPTDPGQLMLRALAEGANQFDDCSIKIEYPDSGQVEYTTGKVFNFEDQAGAIDNMRMGSSELQPNYKSVYV